MSSHRRGAETQRTSNSASPRLCGEKPSGVRLLKASGDVARLHAAVKDGGREFPAGTFVVRSTLLDVIHRAALGIGRFLQAVAVEQASSSIP